MYNAFNIKGRTTTQQVFGALPERRQECLAVSDTAPGSTATLQGDSEKRPGRFEEAGA